ncbi:AAA family ATPase [Lentibacillus saliphilus]|uniref:AAA family ATPase n=1 Tax=Lentibacillus saliphilus TaxID=2737028 RepID=UPI001C30A390|nr:MoxR family ATPase [Lentibacillus saliphilus]
MENIHKSKAAIQQVIVGHDEVIELMFVALLAKGHVILESVPGSGKTKLAKAFARVIDGDFSRIQFTPDVLPSDVTGIQFLNPKTKEFELRVGPAKTNILLADEINRATPRTQSSLLEVMEEQQMTIDGITVHVPLPFLVMATQNPVESNRGTFPLPEAQLDRFLMKIKMNYLSFDDEKTILSRYRQHDPLDDVTAILSCDDIVQLQQSVSEVAVSDVVENYLLNIIHQTRTDPDIELGVSSRAALALMRAGQAKAFIAGRTFVSPADIKTLAAPVLEHRIVLSMEASIQKTKQHVIRALLERVDVPVELGVE